MGRSEIFNSSKKHEHLSLHFSFFRQSPKSTLKKSEKFSTENSEIGNLTYKFSQKPPAAGAFILSFPFVFNGVRTHRAWSRIIALHYYYHHTSLFFKIKVVSNINLRVYDFDFRIRNKSDQLCEPEPSQELVSGPCF